MPLLDTELCPGSVKFPVKGSLIIYGVIFRNGQSGAQKEILAIGHNGYLGIIFAARVIL